jgi:hypothetical protein
VEGLGRLSVTQSSHNAKDTFRVTFAAVLLCDVLQAVEAYQALRAGNTAESVNKHYRLHVTACSAAVRAKNYEAADE